MIKGVCGENSREKLTDFKRLMGHWANVVSKPGLSWRYPEVLYVDAYAGPGSYDPDGKGKILGSPLIVQNLLEQKRLDYRIEAIEKDADNFTQLINNLRDGNYGKVYHHYGDNQHIVNHLNSRPKQFGMIFFDPDMSKVEIKNTFDLIKTTSVCSSRFVDIMVYIGAAHYKRCVKQDDFIPLPELIDGISKKYRLIRQSKGKCQYTFMIFTNYKGWADWKKGGWFPVDDDNDDRGPKIWDKIVNTREELKKKTELTIGSQLPLIGLMENTSSIQSIKLLERRPLSEVVAYAKDAIITGLQRFTT